jgi:hypothetical protein
VSCVRFEERSDTELVRSHFKDGGSACDDGRPIRLSSCLAWRKGDLSSTYRRPRATFQSSLSVSLGPTPFKSSFLQRLRRAHHFAITGRCCSAARAVASPARWFGSGAVACRSGWRCLLLFPCVIASWSSLFPLEGSAARHITPTRNIRQRWWSCRSKPTAIAWLKACHCRKLPLLLWRRTRASLEDERAVPASPLQLARCHSAVSCRPPSPEAKVVARAAAATSRLR